MQLSPYPKGFLLIRTSQSSELKRLKEGMVGGGLACTHPSGRLPRQPYASLPARGRARSCDFILLLTCKFWGFWWIQVFVTFIWLTRDFFGAFSPGRIPKPLLTYNFFRRQTENAVKYSICNPLKASCPAFDEARGSSTTHPSQSCSPQQAMETFALDKQGSIYTSGTAKGIATQHF